VKERSIALSISVLTTSITLLSSSLEAILPFVDALAKIEVSRLLGLASL
jgi:hypothetical protein